MSIKKQNFRYFLSCAAGIEPYLQQEVTRLFPHVPCKPLHGGVSVSGPWDLCMQLNLHSRLAQRVLLQLSRKAYCMEQDIYHQAKGIAWEEWFDTQATFRVDATARKSPLKSLNFAALRVKDGIADRFRDVDSGLRPNVDTQRPDIYVVAHFEEDMATIYLDTSGIPLFKRGWRQIQGDAPLKETLAAAMLLASEWDYSNGTPLLDPCCGSGTIVIEAAQLACGIAAGLTRSFAFEKLRPFQAREWQQLKKEAREQIHEASAPIFASDVSFRMVDFARQNARRAGVERWIEFHGGDALQRSAPAAQGVMVINPPYGERLSPRGSVHARESQQHGAGKRENPTLTSSQTELRDHFFAQLASHWKKTFGGWSAWILTPDMKLPQHMRLKETRRIPLWNGPIECRLMRFDIVAGSARGL